MNDLLGVIRRRLPLVILCGLIAFAIATVLAVTSPDSYRATSRLFVATSAQDVTAANQGNLAAQSRARTYALMATGPELLIRAAQRSGVSISGDALAKRITVSAPPDTVLLDVAATASSAQEAAELSDAVAQELVALVQTAEKPLRGGQPSLGLLILQPADAGASKVPAFKPVTVGAFTAIGLVIGGVLALLIPVRFRPLRRRRRRSAPSDTTTSSAPQTDPPTPIDTAAPVTPPTDETETVVATTVPGPPFGRIAEDPRGSTFDAPDMTDVRTDGLSSARPRPAPFYDDARSADKQSAGDDNGYNRNGNDRGRPARDAWEALTDPGTQRSALSPSTGNPLDPGGSWSFRDRFPDPDDRPPRAGNHAR